MARRINKTQAQPRSKIHDILRVILFHLPLPVRIGEWDERIGCETFAWPKLQKESNGYKAWGLNTDLISPSLPEQVRNSETTSTSIMYTLQLQVDKYPVLSVSHSLLISTRFLLPSSFFHFSHPPNPLTKGARNLPETLNLFSGPPYPSCHHFLP